MTTSSPIAEEHTLHHHSPQCKRRWVILWHLPVRFSHWLIGIGIVALILTGFYIGKPYFMSSGEPSSHFFMGWMRFLHFLSAAVLVAAIIVRVYWLFIGNPYETWRSLVPYRKKDWALMWQVIKKYVLIYPERSPHYLGHNPLQQISYTALYALIIFQILSGFAMYGVATPGGFMHTSFGWINSLLGGIQIVRFLHHVATWIFVIFIPVHIYLTVRADALHREGRVSSMISGGRFVCDHMEYVDDE